MSSPDLLDRQSCWRSIAKPVSPRVAPPVVAVNHAVAISRVEGPLSGLAALDAIENAHALERYPLLPAIQAEVVAGSRRSRSRRRVLSRRARPGAFVA